jgi:hypothetical protein
LTRLTLAVVVLAAVLAGAEASDTGLTGGEGHPRARLPLAVGSSSLPEPPLEAAVRKAVDDWNAVSGRALGVPAFRWVEPTAAADVILTFGVRGGDRLMGQTSFDVGADAAIALPVRVEISEPQARGQTDRETLVYQVVAHELGHALGLEHVRDPRSLMCCVYASIDFTDASVRRAYLEARRHPTVESASSQLAAHYERFWGSRP